MYAFITGASSGIGKELAKILAKKGYHLILAARRQDKLEQLKRMIIHKYHVDVIVKTIDLSNEESVKELISELDALPIEIMINNAGFGTLGYVTEQSVEDNVAMIKTNIISPHIFTSWFCKKAEKGYVLNISSIAAFTTPPLFATYGATKSYLYSFGTAMNYELKKQHKEISITTLCPGSVKTEFYRNGGKQSNKCILSAKECAQIALDGMFQKKSLVIPTKSMKLTYILCKICPRKLLLPVQYFLQKQKIS